MNTATIDRREARRAFAEVRTPSARRYVRAGPIRSEKPKLPADGLAVDRVAFVNAERQREGWATGQGFWRFPRGTARFEKAKRARGRRKEARPATLSDAYYARATPAPS